MAFKNINITEKKVLLLSSYQGMS